MTEYAEALIRVALAETVGILDSATLRLLRRRDAGDREAIRRRVQAAHAAAQARLLARVERAAKRAAKKTAAWTAAQVDPQLKALGVSASQNLAIGLPGANVSAGIAVREFTSTGVALITAMSDQVRAQIADLTIGAVREGLRHEVLAEQLVERLGVAQSRAALIARNETLNTYSNLTRIRHAAAGIERYRWETASDERVRDWHADLQGTIHTWDTPPVGGGTSEIDVGHPGSGINCRCIAAAIL